MSWNNVIGQDRVKNLLQRAIRRREIAHAYLFSGGEGVGKDAMAIEFSRVLNCERGATGACDDCGSCKKMDVLQHPNVRLIFPLPVGKAEKSGDDPLRALTDDQVDNVHEQLRLKSRNLYHRIEVAKANFIKVNSVREIRREAAMSSILGGKKIFILVNAESMNAEASNSLLKTLEEPTTDTTFILTTSQKELLLQTIISRCQFVQFDPLGEAEIQNALIERERVDPEQAALVARLANGSYTAAVGLLSADTIAERQGVVQFLRLVLSSHPVALASEVERLSAGTDRSSVERWLKLLRVWLRDALVLRDHGEAGLLNIDHSKDLKSFIQKFPTANLIDAGECVEQSVALIGKNVYLPLILMTLASDLRRHLSS